jgi:4-amino-4-deoxy-L-arabinose transferase-like glycosyltransferase
MGKKVTDYLLYRWRYIVGYGIIGIGVIALLIIAGLYIPGGLSQAEMQSVVDSSHFSLSHFDPSSIVSLPYHLLQRASISIFGVTNLSIKLPSLLLGALSALGMLLLLKAWFRANVAILTTVLVITTGQFLFIAQSGTASIVYIFWSVWLLVAALMVSRRATHIGIWKVILFSAAALSLYTPLSAYILVALASAILLHPHLRYLMRRLLRARAKVALASACALLLIAPLIYALYLQPSLGLTLLGIPSHMPNLLANTGQLFQQYLDFATPSSGTLMTPVYGLGPTILILLGIIRLFTAKYTARSYIISIWAVLLLPVLIINPNFTSITFVPAMLVMAMGINALLGNWYRLFPRNPYARIAGLIPLVVLIGGMMVSGVDRYMYGYLYDPNIAGNFSNDLPLLNTQLAATSGHSVTVVVTPKEEQFYQVATHHYANAIVSTLPTLSSTDTTIVTHDAHATSNLTMPYRIVTDGGAQAADRFYIYKTGQK